MAIIELSMVRGPRERALEEGTERLGDADLVALLLGTGRAEEPVGVLAAALLHEVGGVAGLARVGAGALSLRAGVGAVKGARLSAAVELGRRVVGAELSAAAPAFPDSGAVDAWARPRLAALAHEELWMLALDGRARLRAARRVAMGGLSSVSSSPRDVLRHALREGAAAFLLVHNHPSGDPRPSPADVAFTLRIAEGADLVGTPLVDHVVVAREQSVSMLDLGLLPLQGTPASTGAAPPRTTRVGRARTSSNAGRA